MSDDASAPVAAPAEKVEVDSVPVSTDAPAAAPATEATETPAATEDAPKASSEDGK